MSSRMIEGDFVGADCSRKVFVPGVAHNSECDQLTVEDEQCDVPAHPNTAETTAVCQQLQYAIRYAYPGSKSSEIADAQNEYIAVIVDRIAHFTSVAHPTPAHIAGSYTPFMLGALWRGMDDARHRADARLCAGAGEAQTRLLSRCCQMSGAPVSRIRGAITGLRSSRQSRQ